MLSSGGASKGEEMKIVKKAYKFRIYPTLEQVIFFLKIKILVFQDINVNPIQSKAILQIIKTQYILKIAT